MMKSIMISIKPKLCELIANGKKTIEIRKTRPKINTPFKCYIYCTNSGRPLVWGSPVPYYTDEKLTQTYGYSREDAEKIFGCWNGKVIGEFVCDGVYHYIYDNKRIYGWHISELKIYDEPKELIKFKKPCNFNYDCFLCDRAVYDKKVITDISGKIKRVDNRVIACNDVITRPPQSWCYVNELR